MTKLAEIYDTFQSKVNDYALYELTKEEFDETLFSYFKSARAIFYKCKNNLNLVKNANGEYIFGKRENTIHNVIVDEDGNAVESVDFIASIYNVSSESILTANNFKYDENGNLIIPRKLIIPNALIETELTPYEIEVIVKLMIVEQLKPIVLSSEVLKQSLSDKDFKIYSQANQLRELNLLYRLIQKEANKMITEYSFIDVIYDDRKR